MDARNKISTIPITPRVTCSNNASSLKQALFETRLEMHLRASTLLLTLWAACSSALHESDVGVVDWYKSRIGVPNTETKYTSPNFHQSTEEISVIITATSSNVLAAVDPSNGSIVWRHVYDTQDNIVTLQKQQSGAVDKWLFIEFSTLIKP